MRYSRESLLARFLELDAELTRLTTCHAPEDELWAAFERLVHVPASSIEQGDQRWWWEQVYAMMERHGLTELARPASAGR